MRKHLESHNDVAHHWGNQLQAEGYCGNMFFDGPSIYSYGRHFEIARFVKPKVVLFNSAGYSVSTSKHKTITSRAIPHNVKVFTVPSMFNHKSNVEWMFKTINEQYEEAARSRKYTEHILSRVVGAAAEIRDYCKEFKIKILKKQEAELKKAETCLSEDVLAEVKTKLAEKTKKLLEDNKVKIQEWINCQREDIPRSISKVFLRIKCNDPELVETTLHANVPIKEAKLLYLAIKKDKPVHGFKIGHYTVNGYNNGTLTIGCHKITQDEINRFASLQGWN